MPQETVIVQGKSNFTRNLIILLIIGLLLWQYAVPYYDDSVKRPSDYINDIFNPTYDDVSYKLFVVDDVTNNITEFTRNFMNLKLTRYHVYSFGITINDGASLFGSYKWQLRIGVWNETTSVFDIRQVSYDIPAYKLYMQKTFYIPDDKLIIDYNTRYVIGNQLWKPTGDITYYPGYSIGDYIGLNPADYGLTEIALLPWDF